MSPKIRENSRMILAVAMAVALVGAPAVARVVADYAKNADKVDGKHAVGARAPLAKRAGRLVATNKQGFFPNNIIKKARDANKLDGIDSDAFQQDYEGVAVVARSGGDFSSIQAAIDSATPNPPQRHLVYVAPGTYNETVTMKPYVDVVGAGRDVTTVSCDCGHSAPDAGATVTLAPASDLKELTVENSTSESHAVAVRGDDIDQTLLERLTIRSNGGSAGNVGLSLESSVVNLFRVDASVSGGAAPGTGARLHDSSIRWRGGEVNASGSDAVGIETAETVSSGFSDVAVTDVEVSASSGDVGNRAVVVEGGSLLLQDSRLQGGGPGPASGIDSSGVASVSVVDSRAAGQGTTGTAGINAVDTSLFVRNSFVSGASSSGISYGINFLPTTTGRDLNVEHSEVRKVDSGDGAALRAAIASGNSTVSIRNSRIAALAGTGDVWAISTERTAGTATMTIDASQLESVDDLLENGAVWDTKIGATLLDGGAVTNAGTLTCIHSYNESYTAVSASCT